MRRPARTVVAAAAGVALVASGIAAGSWAFGGAGPSSTGPAGGSRVAPRAQPANLTPTFQPSAPQSTFTAITPCHLVDTRSGHILRPAVTRSFKVSGATDLSGQGGSALGCGIPATAAAISATITTVSETAKGDLLAGAAAGPLVTVVSYGEHVPITTAATLQLSGAAGLSNISVRPTAGETQLVITVNGFYETQIHLIILADGTVWYGTTHLVSITHTANSGSYLLTFDRTLDGCNMLTTSNDARDVQAVGDWGGTTLDVSTTHEAAGTFTSADESFQVFGVC